jgi:alcohol dehydrogenase (cytochrome c)
MGRSFSGDPSDPGLRILRAFNIHTGDPAWQLPETGKADTWGGGAQYSGRSGLGVYRQIDPCRLLWSRQ